MTYCRPRFDPTKIHERFFRILWDEMKYPTRYDSKKLMSTEGHERPTPNRAHLPFSDKHDGIGIDIHCEVEEIYARRYWPERKTEITPRSERPKLDRVTADETMRQFVRRELERFKIPIRPPL